MAGAWDSRRLLVEVGPRKSRAPLEKFLSLERVDASLLSVRKDASATRVERPGFDTTLPQRFDTGKVIEAGCGGGGAAKAAESSGRHISRTCKRFLGELSTMIDKKLFKTRKRVDGPQVGQFVPHWCFSIARLRLSLQGAGAGICL